MITKITNGKFILPNGICEGINLYLEDRSILEITSEDLPSDRIIDAKGKYISSGFIDIHVHGGGGFEFIDGTKESILGAMNVHLNHGTTTIFPTISAYSLNDTCRALESIREVKTSEECISTIGGVHLEGPYFSPKQCGAQDIGYIRLPDAEEYKALVERFGDLIARWSYAPELEGAEDFQRFLKEKNIVGSIGHSDAEIEDVESVWELGCKLITHLYSCTSTVVRRGGFRHLGIIESAWLYDDMDVEVIADGCHLPPKLVKMIYKLKGTEHICLVTDAIRFGGMDHLKQNLGKTENFPYIIEDGVAKLNDRSAFAGSIATADNLVRICSQKAGIPLLDTVKMVTEVPARIMKLPKKGKLKSGFSADLIIFDEKIKISKVILGGKDVNIKE